MSIKAINQKEYLSQIYRNILMLVISVDLINHQQKIELAFIKMEEINLLIKSS